MAYRLLQKSFQAIARYCVIANYSNSNKVSSTSLISDHPTQDSFTGDGQALMLN
jgi:hypothetical protein